MNESTRYVADRLKEYAHARKTTQRETLFAYGAELAGLIEPHIPGALRWLAS